MTTHTRLHKAHKLEGLHLVATDGEIGHVDDLLLDEHMQVQYLVVDTSNLPGGNSVLVPAGAVEAIDSPHGQIRVRLTCDQVKDSPSLDTANIEPVETLKPTLI